MVSFLSRSEGNVLLAMTPGTVHPKPISIGTMLRPERPIFRRSLSITNATRAIYPLSSSKERNRNNVTIVGRKLNTLPTPLQMPSSTSDCNTSLTSPCAIAIATRSVRSAISISKSPDSQAPMTLNVSQNTIAMIAINAGMAVYFPVRILSILALRACSLLSLGFITVLLHTFRMKEKRISAIAAALSSPRSFSICCMICSTASCSFVSSFSLSMMRLSPSASFDAAKRRGMSASLAWSSIRCMIP